MTKPEGPAQEPQRCPCCNSYCSCPCHDATPGPSQPAGAREWLKVHSVAASYADAIATTVSQIAEWMEAYARQRTAAKDAELKACWNQLCDIGFMFDVVTPENNLRLAEIVKHKKEATERERDFLRGQFNAMSKSRALLIQERELLERERDSLREANARLAADLDAALKTGKDGQK